MRLAFFVASAALTTCIALPAAAQSSTPRIDKRQEIQQHRIKQGAQSGQLTKPEARRLVRGQAKVDRMEDRATRDGTVTKKEARRIERAQDTQSKRIYRQKHDRQQRK